MFFYLPFYATMLKNTKDYKMIICVANEKGGSGKSNIAINLAIKLHSLKEDVLLIDSDPQNSVKTFNDIRASKEVPFGFNCVNIFGDSLASQIALLQNKYEILIIDTAGRDCDEMREALTASDILIIPTLPSDLDIAVLNKMIKLYSQFKMFKKDLKAFVVISKASPNPFLQEKIKALKEFISKKNVDDLKLCESVLYEREIYRNAFANGMGVVEFAKKDDNVLKDFESFFNELVSFCQSKTNKKSKKRIKNERVK